VVVRSAAATGDTGTAGLPNNPGFAWAPLLLPSVTKITFPGAERQCALRRMLASPRAPAARCLACSHETTLLQCRRHRG
jgi:hypothetical protein